MCGGFLLFVKSFLIPEHYVFFPIPARAPPERVLFVVGASYSVAMESFFEIVTTPEGRSAVRRGEAAFGEPCWKCGGSGFLNYYAHYAEGECFPCRGSGAERGKFYESLEALDAALVKRAKAAERKAAKEAARQAERAAQWEAERVEREAKAAKERVEREAAAAAKAATYSTLAAEVGERVSVSGVVTLAKTCESQFGSSRLIVLETPAREVVKMFTTAAWAWPVEEGEEISLQAVVKAFDEFQGITQAVLLRPKKI